MALPELERARARVELPRFVERVPPHVRSKLCYEFNIRGNAVTLVECRPYFRDSRRITRRAFARFAVDLESLCWSLKWSDRNGRWHAYDRCAPFRRLAELVAEVERDPRISFSDDARAGAAEILVPQPGGLMAPERVGVLLVRVAPSDSERYRFMMAQPVPASGALAVEATSSRGGSRRRSCSWHDACTNPGELNIVS